MIVFLLVSLGFFFYPRFSGKRTTRFREEERPPDVVTARLIEDRPFETAQSVTENTTDLLKVPRVKN
jgi:hypothetical protein